MGQVPMPLLQFCRILQVPMPAPTSTSPDAHFNSTGSGANQSHPVSSCCKSAIACKPTLKSLMKGSIVQLQDGESKSVQSNVQWVINELESNQVCKWRIKIKIAKCTNMWTYIDLCNNNHPYHLAGILSHLSFSQFSIDLKSKVLQNLLVSHHFADKGL